MKKAVSLCICILLLFGCAAAEQAVALPGSQRLLTLPDAMQLMPLKPEDDALMAYLSPTLEMDVFSFVNETGKSIQNVAEWNEACRTLRLYHTSVFITGSNSKLLAKEFTRELLRHI